MEPKPKNILVINFGQLGDVILSLPAMKAIKDRFPDSRISVVVGLACADIIEMSGFFDQIIPVDRVGLLNGNPLASAVRILTFAWTIRKNRYDFVIDLHSLPETNLLGYISGASHRLFANRESRSIDRLSNFRPKPPIENKNISLTQNYLNVLRPLGIGSRTEMVALTPSEKDIADVDQLLKDYEVFDQLLIGINPGAGHPSRRWPIGNFVELSNRISESGLYRAIVFVGPEEKDLLDAYRADLDERVIVPEILKIPTLTAAFRHLSVLVGNDTGTMHLAAVMGVSVVLLLSDTSPDRYLPTTCVFQAIRRRGIDEITVSEAYDGVMKVLTSPVSRKREMYIT